MKMNITVKKGEVLYFFKVKSLDGSLKKTIHLFQEFLKIFLIQACTIKLKKANLLKGKDAKPWIYGQMSMIARLPIFVLFHNSTLARSWLVYFFCGEKGKGGWRMPEESILLLLGLVAAMLAGCGAAGCFVSNTLSARSRFKKSAKYVDMNTFRVRPAPLKK